MKVLFLIDKSAHNFREIIGFMENRFKDIDKKYIVIDRRSEYNFDDLPNTYRINSYLQFLKNVSVRNLFFECDKIIVSGIFVWQFVLLMFPKDILTKCCFQFWGGDYTRFRNNGFSSYLIKKIIQYQLKHIKAVILLEESEKKEFEFFFDFSGKYFFIPVPNGPERDLIIDKYIRKSQHKEKQRRIIIGNSATKSNNHLEIFDILKNNKLKNASILCPLSYGDSDYAKIVNEKGYEYFKDNFFPIFKMLSFSDYVELLSTCDVGIYNHDRQQALGNISLMIGLKKKVYLRKGGPCWNHFERYGIILNDIGELSCSDEIKLFSWSKENQITNSLGYMEWRESFFTIWDSIIRD